MDTGRGIGVHSTSSGFLTKIMAGGAQSVLACKESVVRTAVSGQRVWFKRNQVFFRSEM